MPFPQPADHFAPAEAFLHQLPLLLTDRAAVVARGAVIDGAPRFPRVKILRDVRRDAAGLDAFDTPGRIVAFVRALGPTPRAGLQCRQQFQRDVPLTVVPWRSSAHAVWSAERTFESRNPAVSMVTSMPRRTGFG